MLLYLNYDFNIILNIDEILMMMVPIMSIFLFFFFFKADMTSIDWMKYTDLHRNIDEQY